MRALALLVLALLTLGCRPDGLAYESNTSGEDLHSLQGPGSLDPGESALEAIPTVRAPFQARLQMVSEFRIFEEGIRTQSLRELLSADGTGQLALQLEAIAGPDGVFEAATPEQKTLHQRRQLFLAKYRGPVVRDVGLAQRNYSWRQVAGSFELAGIPVVRYRLKSLYGIGDLLLDVDPVTQVLLGWTVRTPSGEPLLRQVALEVNYAPDLQGVTWADPNVLTRSYDGNGESGLLGFDPLKLEGSGPGFERTVEKTLLAQPLFPGSSNIHLSLLGDGVRTVAIAQEVRRLRQIFDGLQEVQAFLLGESEHGGVTVFEGQVLDHWVYAVGSIPRDDLLVLLASLRKPD